MAGQQQNNRVKLRRFFVATYRVHEDAEVTASPEHDHVVVAAQTRRVAHPEEPTTQTHPHWNVVSCFWMHISRFYLSEVSPRLCIIFLWFSYLGLSLCGCVILVHSFLTVLNCQASSRAKRGQRLKKKRFTFASLGKLKTTLTAIACFQSCTETQTSFNLVHICLKQIRGNENYIMQIKTSFWYVRK